MTLHTTQRTSEGSAARTSDRPASSRKFIFGGVALLLVLGGFYYWSHSGNDVGVRRAATVPVTVAAVRQMDMPVVKDALGTVVANTTVSVTARVQGQLTQAFFKEGQMVKTGDLIFQIDPRPYQAALTQATGQLQKDEAALANAEADAKRYGALYGQNAISTQQRDNSEATAKSDAALVTGDRGMVEAARLNLEFTQIRAPVDGKTGPILLQPGNLVSVNGLTQPLVTISQIQPVKISFNLPQSDLPRIQSRFAKGTLTAQVNLHNQGGKTINASVNFVSNAVNTAGTIELRATFPNLDNALVPGQLVDVTAALDDIPGAIVVPRIAVINGPDGNYVYRVNDKASVEMVPVTVQFDDGTNMAVNGDLKGGEQVITDGGLRVVPGSKVSFRKLAAAPAKGARPARGARGARSGGKAL
ncbi:MAG TPA: efflux RND transporter periplasmic adaptor subunit [Rhizomicrobium sp.]|nr:efflux RND transporter periplasmic adaptor subunit [Rhizomicrobium sp.]